MLVVALVLLLEGCKSEVLFRQPRDASPSSPFCGASCADCDVVQKAGVSCVVFFFVPQQRILPVSAGCTPLFPPFLKLITLSNAEDDSDDEDFSISIFSVLVILLGRQLLVCKRGEAIGSCGNVKPEHELCVC